MLKNFKIYDFILLITAGLSLVYSEILYFLGNHLDAIFIGIWVPTIICFGIYLKTLKNNKND
jgi:hypothetical protein